MGFLNKLFSHSTQKQTKNVPPEGLHLQGDTLQSTQKQTKNVPPEGLHLQGDTLQFGRWNQLRGNDPLEWMVLAREGNKALVISRYILEFHPYRWEDSSETRYMDAWVHRKFLDRAFTEEERRQIDSAFLLSTEEATRYLKDPSVSKGILRICKDELSHDRLAINAAEESVNKYQIQCDRTFTDWHGRTDDSYYSIPTWWWLRSDQTCASEAPFVNMDGDVVTVERPGTLEGGIRPAMWVYVCEEDIPTIDQERSDVSEDKPDKDMEREETAEDMIYLHTEGPDALVRFGRYPMSKNGSLGRIWWHILKREGNSVLLVSCSALDSRLYHAENEDTTWEKCTLRKWLNEKFLNAAFTEEERHRIDIREMNDAIFLLSADEVKRYILDDKKKDGHSTRYAGYNGASWVEYESWWEKRYYDCYYWLRSVGAPSNRTDTFAQMRIDNHIVTTKGLGIRPALWLRLDSEQITALFGSEEDVTEEVLEFGRYPWEEAGDLRPIQWKILAQEGSKALVISRYGIDCKPFHYRYVKKMTWGKRSSPSSGHVDQS